MFFNNGCIKSIYKNIFMRMYKVFFTNYYMWIYHMYICIYNGGYVDVL